MHANTVHHANIKHDINIVTTVHDCDITSDTPIVSVFKQLQKQCLLMYLSRIISPISVCCC